MHGAEVSSFLTTCQDDPRIIVRSSFSTIYPQSAVMAHEADRLRQALQSWIDAHPRTAEGQKLGLQTIAKAGRFSESAPRHFLNGGRSMREETYEKFAQGASIVLKREVTVAELKMFPRRPGFSEPAAPAPEPDTSAVPRTPITQRVYASDMPDVPVWASAEAGSEGAMVLVNDPIDWIRRSERLQHVRDPFAFQVIGNSMSPAIEHGDRAVINPALLPVPGKDHVFLRYLEDGTILALVKRLLRSTSTAWKVRQFTPADDFDLPKDIWVKAQVVTEVKKGGL